MPQAEKKGKAVYPAVPSRAGGCYRPGNSYNPSQASYGRALTAGQANAEGTFVNVHGLVACER